MYHLPLPTPIAEMTLWANHRAGLFLIQVDLSDQVSLVLVNSYLTSESHHSFVLSNCHISEAVDDGVGLLLKATNFRKDTSLGVSVRVKVELIKVDFITFFLGKLVDIHLACSISIQVDVVDPVLEFLGHFFPVLVEGFLDDVLVRLRDLITETPSNILLHDFFIVTSSDRKRISLVNWLIEELRALVIKARVIIDHTDDFSLLVHGDLNSKENFVKQAIPNTH
jgi:hypothetical protein